MGWLVDKRCFVREMGFVAALLLLAGCASVGPKTEETPAKTAEGGETENAQAPVAPKNGFIITEDAQIDPESKGDFDRAIAALSAGDAEQGIALLENVIKRSPNAVAPYINLAIAYKKLDKLVLAEDNLKAAIKLSPEHPVANNEYGMLYRKTGRFAEAKATYEKILARYPDFQPARKNLGVLCDIYLRDMECALQNYQVYSAAVPSDKPVTLWIADLQRRMGK